MRIHLCYKTQRVTVNTLWHAFHFQSRYACIELPDQTCQIEPCISDCEAAVASWGNAGFPHHHFIPGIDLM